MTRTLALFAALSLAIAGCESDDDGPSCATGQTNCGGVCRDLLTDPLSCGACLRLCATGASCVSGECRCPAGQTACGAAGTNPGACVDLQTDASNCGSCGQACGLGTCTGGACSCDSGATRCDGANPACVDLNADEANCGTCGNACLTRAECNGSCSCPSTFPAECPTQGYCADLASTTDCGTCGNACAAGGICDGSPAACRCPTGEEVCGAAPGACVNKVTDEANCGGCGRRCPTLATCSAAVCECPVTAPDICGTSPGACVDHQTDEANCGLCGRVCPSAATCTAGTCVCPAATPQTCGALCCKGDQCCGSGGNACQPLHQNGLGQTYVNACDAPYSQSQTTEQAARRAADAWSQGDTFVGNTGCDASCLGRRTATQCAVWCYGISPVAGRVSITNSINCAGACPTLASPVWN